MLDSFSHSFIAGSGTGSVNVTAAEASCNWTAVSNDAFITITSGSSGTGSGTVNYSVDANPSASPRSGTMTIAGRTFTVNQAGIPLSLGNYPNTIVSLGRNTTVTPDATPTSNTALIASTSSGFMGTFTANPTTGIVRVINAQPAGTYTVTVTAFNAAGDAASKTFTLTVNNPMPCDLLSFSSASGSPFTVGSQPASAGIGDFNGDGKHDFAVANWGSNNVTVLMGNGSGGFSSASGSPFSVGSHPNSVAVGDFNRDGNQDLAIANSGSANVSVLLGDGSGGFSPAGGSPISVGLTPESVAIADFNGDGKLDLATANWNTNNVTVLLGNGSGGFSPATGSPFGAGTNPASVAVGDFNVDGKSDLTIANWNSNNVTVLLGDGSGGFAPAAGSPFAGGTNPNSVAVGDLNGDGKLDLATANYLTNNATVLLGNGSGGFSPAAGSPFSVGTHPWSVSMGDFNGDGALDLTTTNLVTDNVSLLLGNGSGSFSAAAGSPFAVGLDSYSVAIGDFNADGRLDLATVNDASNNVTVLLNSCTLNTPPSITTVSVTRQQGSPSSNSTIANVNDAEDAEASLTVTVNGGSSATVNGVTVSGISANSAGVVTANVIASCSASIATFTLRVTDTLGLFNEATLTVTVNSNTAPTLTYASPQSVAFAGSLNVNPTATADNGSVTYSVQAGHGLTTAPTVDSAGVVSITNAQPAGAHTITIRATDNCGSFTDASFTLNVGDLPTFTIDDVSHNEGNSGTTSYTFTVTKTGSTGANATVNFATADGTATTADNDLQAQSNTLTFLPADTTKTITVLVNGDVKFESDEAFTVHLSNATGATIADADGTGTITNDDGMPTLTIDDVIHNEGNAGTTSYTSTVTKTGSTALNAVVNYNTVNGTATTADNDYQAQSGSLTFLPADTTKTITILANGDTAFEPAEAFTVHLSTPTGATIADADGTGTITNDDAALPTLGNYPDKIVPVPSASAIVPGAAPTNTTSVNVSTTSTFTGILSASATTGVVMVTNAQPAGTYTVTVKAFNSAGVTTTKTFTLTVTNSMHCDFLSFSGASGSPFAAGTEPESVAVSDFNGDGKQDLAVANTASNNVMVLLGNGTGGFSAASGSPFAVDTHPNSVAVGDFNGDGNQDFATANVFANNITVLLGNGAGGFSEAIGSPFAIGASPHSIAVGDFNSDGKLDVATANTNNATVLLGDGIGGFTEAIGSPFPVGMDPFSLAVGDFNGDGKLDLTIANVNSNNVTVLLGDGSGGFTPAGGSPFAVGSRPYCVAVADFNGDGKQDLTTASETTSSLTVLLGNGTGGFTAAMGSPFAVGMNPHSVAVADFNGDGKQDLAAANPGSASLTVLFGDGSGGFSVAAGSPFPVGSAPRPIAAGDFNGDGKLDLATANIGSNDVTVLLNTCTSNSAPTISAVAVTRQQGSPSANSIIANVNDAEDPESALTVTVNGGAGATVNGVMVSGISVSSAGVVTADVIAGCSSTTATYTLRVTDTGSVFNEATLTVTVDANTSPTLTYASPQTVVFGGSLNVSPTAAGDNGTVNYAVQPGHGMATAPTVDSNGVVSITNAQPAGAHTITIRVTDNCGSFSDGAFTLNVGGLPAFTIDDVTHNEGNAGTTSYTFTVTKTGSSGLNSTVNFTTVDGSATTTNNDYQALSGSLTFLPADAIKQITVLVIGDTTFESDEAFTLHLSSPTNATIADADGAGTITNDDAAPTFTIDDVTHNEGNAGMTSYTFTVSKTGGTALNSSVNFTTVDGSATMADNDYQTVSGTLSFSASDAAQQITVFVFGDTKLEPDEAFTVHLSNPTGASLSDADGAGSIVNDDSGPSFSIDDVTHNEGNAGTTSFTFTVTKTGTTALNSSVNFTTVDGTATTADSDYQAQSGMLTFLPSDTTKQVTVLVNGDMKFEPDEAFTVHLSNSAGATIADADGAGAITNDDSAPTFAIDDVTHNEANAGTTSYTFTVTKTGGTALNSSVNFATADGTATTASADYQSQSGALTFLPADTTKQVTVLVNGDTTFEPDEAFTVHLSSVSGATIADADGLGTITNDDNAPTFAIDDVTHNEGNAGTTSYTFTVTKTGVTALNSSVNFTTADGTAKTSDNDYQPVSGDTISEADEAFTVHLSGATGATISDADGTGAITNDDGMPTLAIDDVTHNEGNGGTTSYTFTVTKTGSTALNVSVNFTTVDGSATIANNDYQTNSGSLTFLPGDTTKMITILVNGDTTVEQDEAFTVHLSGASGATINDADGTGSIINDDCSFSLSGNSQNFFAAGGTGSVNVMTSSACGWNAVNNDPSFITITSGSSAIGNGTVN